MKKYLFIGLGMALIITSIIFMKGNITGMIIQEEKILLGYCPSMELTAQEISKQNPNVEIVRKDSTIDVLENLKSNGIDIALVGRLAKSSELPNNKQRMISSGYTLVSSSKQFIQKNELKTLTIHTALDPIIVQDILPDSKIIYYNTLEDTLREGMDQAVLIDWDDYKDYMELVVVMEGELKDLTFRTPVLYSIDYDLNDFRVKI